MRDIQARQSADGTACLQNGQPIQMPLLGQSGSNFLSVCDERLGQDGWRGRCVCVCVCMCVSVCVFVCV